MKLINKGSVRRSLTSLPLIALACGGLLAMTSPAAGSAASSKASAADPKIPFTAYQLKNGLEVILAQDNETPLVSVNVWYHVGGADETPGKSGFAHLFEHMLFQGSQNVGEDMHFETLKKIGGSEVNGSTSTDRTNYYQTVPSHQLEAALWLESDRMGFLLPVLTEKSLKNQIDVVRNERRQRIDNSPYGKTFMTLSSLLYPEGHPHHFGVIGKHEDLQAASIDDVKNFYRKWYTPANATLVIAGDFETGRAKALVEKWFGDLAGSAKPQRTALKMPQIKKMRQTIEEELVRQRMLTYAWHTPAAYSQEDADFDLIASVLGNPGTGRIYRRLVLEEKLATQVSVRQRSQQYSSIFQVQVLLTPEADLARAEKVIQEEIGKITSQEIPAPEFKRAVKEWETGFVWGLESLMARAETLQTYNHFWGNPEGISRNIDRYRQARAQSVLAAAKKYLGGERVELVTMPAAKS